MSFTFDGPNKRVILSAGTVSISAADLYSRWKDWVAQGSNSRFAQAMRVVGGDPTVSGLSLGSTYFMMNGWKARPQEANHVLAVDGNLYSEDGSSPFVPTLGTFQVLILQKVTNLIDQVSVNGSSIDAGQVASAVRAELTPELTRINANLTDAQATMLLEIYRLLGLDPAAPLVVSDTLMSAGSVALDIVSNASQTSVTRR